MSAVISSFLFGTVPGCTGHNFTTEFANSWPAWNTYQDTQSTPQTLCLPAGTFAGAAPDQDKLVKYAPGGTVKGVSSAVTTYTGQAGFTVRSIIGKDGFGDGTNATAGGAYQPRIATVSAGATSVTVISSFETLDYWFSVGTPVIICGFDVQGYGFPINNQVFEYNYVASIGFSPGDHTGTIGLETPLRFDYSQNWPLIYGGDTFTPDEMGSPGIQALHADWDSVFVARDFTWNNGTLTQGSNGRSILLENIIFEYNYIPSNAHDITFRNCVLGTANGSMEVDKLVEILTFENCTHTIDQILVQSTSIGSIVATNSTFLNFSGLPRSAIFTDCIINGDLVLGPTAYGAAREPYIFDNVHVAGFGNSFQRSVAFSLFTSFSAGTFTIPTATVISTNVLIDLMPGGYYILAASTHPGGMNFVGPVFQVTDVERSGANTLYHTTLVDPCPQLLGGTYPADTIFVHPAPWITVTNTTTGGLRAASYPAGALRPIGCYGKTTEFTFSNVFPYVTGSVSGRGYLEQITINVTKAYTGTQPTLSMAPFCYIDGSFSPLIIIKEDATTYLWRPSVDLKTTGTRVITSGSITGSVGSDALGVGFTGVHNWANTGNPGMTADISGESSSVWPELEVELILNHDIPPP